MVGLYSGLPSTFMIDVNLSRTLRLGVGSLRSNILSSAVSEFEDGEQIEEMKSLG